MRRDQRQPADAMILMTAGIDRGNRGAVAVADQQPALEADGIEQGRQRFARLVVHVSERARQRDRARLAVAGARIDENATPRRVAKPVGKIAPQADAAEPLVQQNQRRRLVRPRPDHAVFQALRAEREEAGIREGHDNAYTRSSARSLKR